MMYTIHCVIQVIHFVNKHATLRNNVRIARDKLTFVIFSELRVSVSQF